MVSSRTTVLVIDDEASIRRLIQRMLEPNVCQVVEAQDAEAGLRLIERGDPPIDVVLTDWIMSGLHGLDVVEVLQVHCPSLPVAVISAYTSTIHPIVRKGESLRILEKPFTGPDLQRTVQDMIARALRQRRPVRHDGGATTVDLVGAAWALHHARATRP
jgi:two-component system cell cycle sensor histidine kinase/response regulator CckA